MKAVRKHGRQNAVGEVASLQNPSAVAAPVLTSTCPTTFELRGISIHFPFEPYDCQRDYMGKVLDALNRGENALLESPTGTGKTLCLLCATLAWQREQARLLQQNRTTQVPASQIDNSSSHASSNKAPTILYASRTHSQLSQVVRELSNTRYRPKHAVLGSREQMCVHPKVKTATATAWEVNHDCQKLNKERKCRYRNQLEGFQPDQTVRGEAASIQPVLDMEDLVAMGKTRKVCPFYYTRSLVPDAELILIPYNYLFDKDARESTLAEVPWDNAIVIFDEAHNLESFASDSASFDLTTLQVAGCIAEVTRTGHYAEANPGFSEIISTRDLVRLKSLFLNMEAFMLQSIPPKQSVYSGEYMLEILTKGMSINHANHTIFLSEVAKVTDLLLEIRGSSSSSKTGGSPQLEAFAGCVKRVFGESTEARCFAKAQCYRVHVTARQHGAGRTISYWCFAPSLAMQELSNLNVRSILVTSGTLSPLPSYSMELGLPFPHTLENPHIIEEDQIHVRVVGHGVSGKLLTSSYQRRDDSEYILELGNSLVSFARIIPGGMLIFFPSYGVMEMCVERWGGPSSRKSQFASQAKDKFFQARRRKGSSLSNQYAFPHAPDYYARSNDPSTPWKRMLCQKAIVLEPRSTGDLSDAIGEFHKFLDRPKSTGCILMGVCRGKISEGIDFRDKMCRAVVITGLPFAPYLDPKVKLKREYLDGVRAGERVKASGEGGFGNKATSKAAARPITLSGAEWYTQQAHRAVNQAVGRVIRNKTDYGAVLLLDSRFGEPRNQQGLSKWVRPHVRQDGEFGIAIGNLVRFFKAAGARERQRSETVHLERGRNITLAYENDKLFGSARSPIEVLGPSTTKIAVIQNKALDAGSSEGDANVSEGSSGFFPPDRILAHVELRDMEAPKGPVQSELPKGIQQPVHGLEALYRGKNVASTKAMSLRENSDKVSSAWGDVDVSKFSERRAHNLSSLASKRPHEAARSFSSNGTKKKNGAAVFFQKAKAEASPEDLVSIRKAVIEMKGYGDKRDVTSYLRAARGLVHILLRYENFDAASPSGKIGMLELFYSLLPHAYRGDVEKLALRMSFRRSEFHKHIKTILNPADFTQTSSNAEDLLLKLHCQGSSASFTPSAYLREARSIIKVIITSSDLDNAPNSSRTDLVRLFLRLVPNRFTSATYALIEELKSTRRIQVLKQAEKANSGEQSVDTRIFKKPRANPRKPTMAEDSTPDEAETRNAMESALMRAEELNSERRERLRLPHALPVPMSHRANPYATKPQTAPASVIAVAKPEPSHRDDSRSAKRICRSTSSSPSTYDPIVSVLREAESTSFVDRRQRNDGAQEIRSNLPRGFKCNICEKPPEKVFLAKCGHTACSTCWSQWLQKSRTCPHCREPVEKDQLERVVFERTAGAGGPTLSTPFPRDDDGESSEEEELELILG